VAGVTNGTAAYPHRSDSCGKRPGQQQEINYLHWAVCLGLGNRTAKRGAVLLVLAVDKAGAQLSGTKQEGSKAGGKQSRGHKAGGGDTKQGGHKAGRSTLNAGEVLTKCTLMPLSCSTSIANTNVSMENHIS
jgi:hypothetical protein